MNDHFKKQMKIKLFLHKSGSHVIMTLQLNLVLLVLLTLYENVVKYTISHLATKNRYRKLQLQNK